MRCQVLLLGCVVLFWMVLASPARGAMLPLVRGGASAYAIVIPDRGGSTLDLFMQQGAAEMQRVLRRASGVTLPILDESDLPPGQPGVFIGATRALAASGLAPAQYACWEHRIACREGHIYLFGDDAAVVHGDRHDRDPSRHVLGSLKAMVVFLEKFAGASYCFPAAGAFSVESGAEIGVPDDYAYRQVPPVSYVTGRPATLFYDLANNFLMGPWYGTYGGHSHDKAIPPERYFAEHPEYFALLKGQRQSHPERPQYCLSNPAVQELIYQELLAHADQGYRMVQLGQSDGFRACECADCVALYGVAEAGEKLWILHLRLAERFLRDRPGKQLCIMAYGPTRVPPRTFSAFPENVAIELAPYSDEIMAEWQQYTVPRGFVVYLYNWGYYKPQGFTPKQTRDFCQRQAASFVARNVQGVYRCGFGELPALEGAVYYQWGRQLGDPSLDSQALTDAFCRGAFGPAAPQMRAFYDLLDQRLHIEPDLPAGSDWNDPALLDGHAPAMFAHVWQLALRYPPDVVATMAELVQQTETLLAQDQERRPLLDLLRMEFDYLRLTAAVASAQAELRRDLLDRTRCQTVLQAVAARNAFIAALPQDRTVEPPRIAVYAQGLRRFGYAQIDEMFEGGRLGAPLRVPYCWDAEWMQARDILPVGRQLTARPPAAPLQFQTLIQRDFYAPAKEIRDFPIDASCSWDEHGLYVVFRLHQTGAEAARQEQIQVLLGPELSQVVWFPARARSGHAAAYLLRKTNLDNQGQGHQFTPPVAGADRVGSPVKVMAPAPGFETAENMATVQLHIPWDWFPRKPEAGETWQFNLFAERQLNAKKIGYVWEYNIFQKTWRNLRDSSGRLTFAALAP